MLVLVLVLVLLVRRGSLERSGSSACGIVCAAKLLLRDDRES